MTSDIDVTTFDELPLDTLEEAGGELVRRITVAMRLIGEQRADESRGGERSPRQWLARLIVLVELAGQTLAAAAAGSHPPSGRVDRHPAAIAAVMYGAPTIAGLLQRLEQNRRMLASHARGLEDRLGEPARGAWEDRTLRTVLSEVSIVAPAECVEALESQLARWDEEARRAATATEIDL